MSERRLAAPTTARTNIARAAVAAPPAGAVGSSASEVKAEDVVQLADGELLAGRDAPLGGQAVLEGVMMRGISSWAVAVRKPVGEAGPAAGSASDPSDDGHDDAARGPGADGHGPAAPGQGADMGNGAGARTDERGEAQALGEIEVTSFPLDSALRRHRVLRLPIIRGVVALGGSLAIGFRALEISANAQLPAEEHHEEPQEIGRGMWAGTIVVALAFAIVLFFLVPVGLTSLIKDQLHSSVLFWLVEGLVRTSIFLGYLLLLSRVRDLRRVFEYHGAEHKTISCYEAGLALTPPNAQRFSRLHPRCGTSFLLVVMIVAIFVFAPIGLPAWYWLVLTRILGVPLIAGISFELIKYAGRNRARPWVRAVMWPGLKLQLLTTREPELDQLAVAIAALEAVLATEELGELTAADLVGVEVVA